MAQQKTSPSPYPFDGQDAEEWIEDMGLDSTAGTFVAGGFQINEYDSSTSQAHVVEAGGGQAWVDDWALIELSPADARGGQADAGAGGAGWRIGEPVVGEDVIIVGYPGAAAGELVVLSGEVARIRPDGSFELKLATDSQHQVDAYSSLLGLSGGAVLRAADAEGCHALLGMARGGRANPCVRDHVEKELDRDPDSKSSRRIGIRAADVRSRNLNVLVAASRVACNAVNWRGGW